MKTDSNAHNICDIIVFYVIFHKSHMEINDKISQKRRFGFQYHKNEKMQYHTFKGIFIYSHNIQLYGASIGNFSGERGNPYLDMIVQSKA